MKVTVCGGGAIGTQFAFRCASIGHDVTMLVSKPQLFRNPIEYVDEYGNQLSTSVKRFTSNIAEAVSETDIVFVTYPSFMFHDFSKKLLPHVFPGMNLCLIPGTGGGEFQFKECIEAGMKLSGLQRVPSVARLLEYGKTVRCEGYRKELFVAALNKTSAKQMGKIMTQIWGMPCTVLPNYLNITLTPSNPILHTSRLRCLFEDFKDGVVYHENAYFYGDWDLRSSQLLLAMDQELQDICNAIPELDLKGVISLKRHYESNDAEALTKKISSINSLKRLSSPMLRVEGGWIPDLGSRYFIADFPYGLALIESLANLIGVKCNAITETMQWYKGLCKSELHCFKFSDYGIHSKSDLLKFYSNSFF